MLDPLGQIFGSYRIVESIGTGGMGAVYLAEHTMMGKQAALKVLLPELSNREDLLSRFFNEARAAAAIKHPGIVEVIDFGHAHDCAYILMEYLEGESLSDRLSRVGALPVSSALRLCGQLARSLAAAHRAAIVHRDLKPDNIIMVADTEVLGGERTKLLDFGIAKLAAGTGMSSATRTGAVLGTPLYMAPEQCKGAGQVDHRADLYALGCILFHMLCGQPPFTAVGAGEIMACHIFAPPPVPSDLRPELPPKLDALIAHALDKNPATRVQSADDMLALIEELQAGDAAESGHVSTHPPGDPEDWPTTQMTSADYPHRPSTAPVPAHQPPPQTRTTLGSSATSVDVIQLRAPRPPRRSLALALTVAALLGGAAGFWLHTRDDSAMPLAPLIPASVQPADALSDNDDAGGAATPMVGEASASAGLPDAGLPDAGLPNAREPRLRPTKAGTESQAPAIRRRKAGRKRVRDPLSIDW